MRGSRPSLTEDELKRLVDLKVSGARIRFIAATLGCSERTVQLHLSRSKKELSSRVARLRSYRGVKAQFAAQLVSPRRDQQLQAASVLARRVSMHVGPWFLDRDGCMTRRIMSKETRRELDNDRGVLDDRVELDRPRLRAVESRPDEGQCRAVDDGPHPDGDSVLDWEVARAQRDGGEKTGVSAETQRIFFRAADTASADGVHDAEPAKEDTGGEQAS